MSKKDDDFNTQLSLNQGDPAFDPEPLQKEGFSYDPSIEETSRSHSSDDEVNAMLGGLAYGNPGYGPDITKANSANESSKEDKPLNELQEALKEKFEAEKKFIGGAQTRKTDTESLVLEVRKLEALAKVRQLEADAERLRYETAKLEAERSEREATARYISGPSSYKTRQEGHTARFQRYFGVFVLLLIFLVLLYAGR